MADSSDKTRCYGIVRLNRSNYKKWAYTVRIVLEGDDLWGVIDGSDVRPMQEGVVTEKDKLAQEFAAALKGYERKCRKATKILILSIEEEVQDVVFGMHDPAQIWAKLSQTFMPKSRLRRLQTYRALATASPKEGEDLQDYVNRVRQLSVEAEEAGNDKTSDETICTILLAGLPEKFNAIVTMTEALADSEYNSQRIEYLIVGESRRQQHMAGQMTDGIKKHPMKEEVLITIRDGKPKAGPRSRYPFKRTIRCYTCNEVGHVSRDSTKQKPKDYKKSEEQKIAKNAKAAVG